jgi:hypothetical protein
MHTIYNIANDALPDFTYKLLEHNHGDVVKKLAVTDVVGGFNVYQNGTIHFIIEIVSELCETYHFFILDNERLPNAITFELETDRLTPVIGLYAGTITAIGHYANLFALCGDFMRGVGEAEDKIPRGYHKDLPEFVYADGALDVVYLIQPDDPHRQALASAIISLAQRFILLHEIGHHENGDFRNALKDSAIHYNMAINREDSMPQETRQAIEFEADMYAASHIFDDFHGIKESLCNMHALELDDEDIFSMLLSAVCLVFLVMPRDGEAFKSDNESKYLPSVLRMTMVCLTICMTNQDALTAAISETLANFTEDERKAYESHISDVHVVGMDTAEMKRFAHYASSSVGDNIKRYLWLRDEDVELFSNDFTETLGRFGF